MRGLYVGDNCAQYHRRSILELEANGVVTLRRNGEWTTSTMKAMNEALRRLSIPATVQMGRHSWMVFICTDQATAEVPVIFDGDVVKFRLPRLVVVKSAGNRTLRKTNFWGKHHRGRVMQMRDYDVDKG